MTPHETLSEDEVGEFADMHRRVLPNSLVARLGHRYARAFYRYIDSSSHEFVLVQRDNGRLVAGCVVSCQPDTLSKRLLKATPVVRSLVGQAMHIPWPQIASGLFSVKPELPPYPEILLIFAKPESQGCGYGTALVDQTEASLARRGFEGLRVKTLAAPNNPAQAFYRRCGFQSCGEVVSLGKRLAVFSKQLAPLTQTNE